ncbi:hypothetical protein JB92DRAFT_2920325 [Gautieria morchelliformis]|nr:hypothetical protein JB92DRAFT_2920325 [Gautieria morchelliformis]
MQPLHRDDPSRMLPDNALVSRPNAPAEYPITETPKYPITETLHPNTNDVAIPLPTAEELLSLLDQIDAEMENEIGRVAAAISEVEDCVKQLRFSRMRAGGLRRAQRSLEAEEGRNNMQFL